MTPIQKLKEENMLLRKGLQDALKKLNEVHHEADRTIGKLNETAHEKYPHMSGMYDVTLSYMMEIGRFAWGERGKQITGYYVRPVIMNTLDKLKTLQS